MTEFTHGRKDVREMYAVRTLDESFPEIRQYLTSGATVLDVGCGPGSITIGVAQEVEPGRVVGMDAEPKSVTQARQSAAEAGIDNVDFGVGDAYALDYADDTFDLAYSRAVIDWLRYPVKALREQRRVTKKGGWVVMFVGDYGSSVIYPLYPCMERIRKSWQFLSDPSYDAFYWNPFVGRRSVELLSLAGLTEIRVQAAQALCSHAQGAKAPSPGVPIGLAVQEYRRSPDLFERLKSMGIIDEWTLEQVDHELEEWKKCPYAFSMLTRVLAAGRVE